MKGKIKIIITGGGTGGHVFPAIAIANALQEREQDIHILFVGAEHKMEMKQVPAAGYEIIGLPVRGFRRRPLYKNIPVLFYLMASMIKAIRIIGKFRPNAVVGVGGYASGPVARAAQIKGIPLLIQEQNSFAGVTNRLLAKKAAKICVAYDGMEAYFPSEKIIFTGNPVRRNLTDLSGKRKEALTYFGITGNTKVILIIGGSIGAGSINSAITASIEKMRDSGFEFIWQTGSNDYQAAASLLKKNNDSIHVYEFIPRMDLAYSVTDLVISRAGAGTISELAVTGKPAILVPSPNVAEDHQTKNAMALVASDAAIMVTDKDCDRQLVDLAIDIALNEKKLSELKKNILALARPESAEIIAKEILKLAKQER